MTPFAYHRPTTVADIEKLLASDAEATLLAGGMTLVPTLKMRLAQPSALIDLSLVAELKGIKDVDEQIQIGAMSTHASVAQDALIRSRLPALARLAGSIGDPQVRNRGTIGGSLANSDPAADYPAAVLALNACVVTQKREIAADDFFLEMFETALEPGEIITAVRFPLPDAAAYAKFPNPASRYAMAGVFVARQHTAIRVAVTGAASCVFRAHAIEAALQEKFSPDVLADIDVDSRNFNSDLHASAEYRAQLVRVMAQRAVAAALA